MSLLASRVSSPPVPYLERRASGAGRVGGAGFLRGWTRIEKPLQGILKRLFDFLETRLTQICVTLRRKSTTALIERMASLAPLADLFEIRADLVRDLDLLTILRARTRPSSSPAAPARKGGALDDADPRRPRLLLEAIKRGLRLRGRRAPQRPRRTSWWRRPAAGLVVSLHDLEGTPDDLDGLYAEMVDAGRRHREDRGHPALDRGRGAPARLGGARARRRARRRSSPWPWVRSGILTRILAGRYGAPFTFASADAAARSPRPARSRRAHGRPLPRARRDAARRASTASSARTCTRSLSPGPPQPRLRRSRPRRRLRAPPGGGARRRSWTRCPRSACPASA